MTYDGPESPKSNMRRFLSNPSVSNFRGIDTMGTAMNTEVSQIEIQS